MRNFAEQLEGGRAGLGGSPSDLMGEMTSNLPRGTMSHWTVQFVDEKRNKLIRGGLHDTEAQAVQGFDREFNSVQDGRTQRALDEKRAVVVYMENGDKYRPCASEQVVVFSHGQNDGFHGSESVFRWTHRDSQWATQQRAMAEAKRQK